MKALPSLKMSTILAESVTKCCAHLEKLVSSVKEDFDQFSGMVSSVTNKLKLPQTSSGAAVEHSLTNIGQSHPTAKYNRSNNVILFGLPKSSLLN